MTDPAVPPPQISLIKGNVKSVLTGNRFIIRGTPKNPSSVPPEKVLVLNNVKCPETARGATKNMPAKPLDDTWAWEIREWVRKTYIGKNITFSIEHVFGDGAQVAGNLWLEEENPKTDRGLIEKGLSLGWFSLQENCRDRPDLEDLVTHAKNKSLGRYNMNATPIIRQIKWDIADNPKSVISMVKQAGNKQLDAQVEFVLSGNVVKVYLTELQCYLVVQLSGVKCPAQQKAGAPVDEEAKWYQPARLFSESRLMHRDVKVILDHADDEGRVCATILHPRGNIAEFLLQEGLAKCADWSMRFYKLDPSKLRAAMATAKNNRKRIWQNYQTPTANLSETTLQGTVKQILTTDTILLKIANKPDMKITFSSVRALNKTDFGEKWANEISKAENAKKGGKVPFSPILDIPVNFDAKKFLVEKIGKKKVRVVIDYVQEAREIDIAVGTEKLEKRSFPKRTCCSVFIGETNIAEALASRGYVKVITHGSNDDNRSSEYDKLTQAEEKAKTESRGCYAKNLSLPRIQDINGKERATPYFSSWQRTGRFNAIVDYVFSGNRLKCYVPKDNVNIMVIMAGIECPRTGQMKGGVRITPSQPFAEEAQAFTTDAIMQTEVSIEVVDMDKWGSFVAYVHTLPKRDNFSVALCENGYASVHWSAEKHGYSHLLEEAETRAKNKNLNIWKDYVEQEQEITTPEASGDLKAIPKKFTGMISDIPFPDLESESNAIIISVQNTDAESTISRIQCDLNATLGQNPPITGSIQPRRGQIIAAKWPVDNQWYRAKVEKQDGTNMTVMFIDFGNKDEFKILGNIGQIPAGIDSAAFPAQSKQFKLAYVDYPKTKQNNEFVSFAHEELCHSLINQKVNFEVRYRGYNAAYESVSVRSEVGEDLVAELVQEGYIVVARKERINRELFGERSALQDLEREASRGHKNVWRYGDIYNDEE